MGEPECDVIQIGDDILWLRRRERLENDRLKDEDGVSVQAQLRSAMAGSFFCRTNLSVSRSSEQSPNQIH